MRFIIILLLIGMMAGLPTVDIVPCKDGYQIIVEHNDGNCQEYFICDTRTKDKIADDP